MRRKINSFMLFVFELLWIVSFSVVCCAEDTIEDTEESNEFLKYFDLLEPVPAQYLLSCKHPGTVCELSVSMDESVSENEEKHTIYVYLPYGYDDNCRYDIIYHQCGLYSTDNELMKYSDFKNVLDNLIDKKNINPVIFVILPDGLYDASMPLCEHAEEIMYLVEEKYSTYAMDLSNGDLIDEKALKDSSSHRMISGFSQGAYATWNMIAYKNGYADYYMPFSPFYYEGWNYEYLIRMGAGEKDRIHVFNTIGERECEPDYPYDGIGQLYGIREAMNGYPDCSFYVIKDGQHSQINCMQAYYHCLQKYFTYVENKENTDIDKIKEKRRCIHNMYFKIYKSEKYWMLHAK